MAKKAAKRALPSHEVIEFLSLAFITIGGLSHPRFSDAIRMVSISPSAAQNAEVLTA